MILARGRGGEKSEFNSEVERERRGIYLSEESRNVERDRPVEPIFCVGDVVDDSSGSGNVVDDLLCICHLKYQISIKNI